MSFGYGSAIDDALREFGVSPDGKIAVLSEARGAQPASYDAAIAAGALDGLSPAAALAVLVRATRPRGIVALWSDDITGGFKAFFGAGFERAMVRAVPVQSGETLRTAYLYLGETV